MNGEPNGKVLHFPERPKNGEFLRVRMNDQETVVYTTEEVCGELYLNAHIFMELDGKLLPTDRATSIAMSFYPAALEHWRRMEQDIQQTKQTFAAVEQELIAKGIISFTGKS